MADDKETLYSKYYLSLDSVGKERYQEKLKVKDITITDPYMNSKNWEENITRWPSVDYGNVYNYLINTPGIYTKERMQAYKSLDGYNYFLSGHVQTCFYNDVSKESPVCVLKAKVTPSQRINDKSHEAWVVVQKTGGYVVAAHCTCKAGLGEACSHIAAVLFKVMKAGEMGLNEECKTSVACGWNKFFRTKVQAQPVIDMNFSRNQQKKKRRHTLSTNAVEDVDEENALRELKRVCPSACILTKNDSDTDSASDDEDFPPLLNRFHEMEYTNLSKDELEEKCQRFVRDFAITDQQAANLEQMTRAQSNSPIWHRQRQGRITATVAHDVISLKQNTSKMNIIKKIMRYNTCDLSNIEAIRYGRKNEDAAKLMYENKMKECHRGFISSECGLFIDGSFPLFAATPDGVRSCTCHGEGIVEIKCSYKHRDSVITDIEDPNFFLDKNMHLKKSHRYFTQVQFQMFVCSKQFCDFVVYTNKCIFVTTVNYDGDFVRDMVDKCLNFALQELVPEIIQHKLQA